MAATADILNLKIRLDKYLKTYSTQRPNFMNLSYVAVLPTDSKLKIKEGLKLVIQIWTGGGWQFKVI